MIARKRKGRLTKNVNSNNVHKNMKEKNGKKLMNENDPSKLGFGELVNNNDESRKDDIQKEPIKIVPSSTQDDVLQNKGVGGQNSWSSPLSFDSLWSFKSQADKNQQRMSEKREANERRDNKLDGLRQSHHSKSISNDVLSEPEEEDMVDIVIKKKSTVGQDSTVSSNKNPIYSIDDDNPYITEYSSEWDAQESKKRAKARRQRNSNEKRRHKLDWKDRYLIGLMNTLECMDDVPPAVPVATICCLISVCWCIG